MNTKQKHYFYFIIISAKKCESDDDNTNDELTNDWMPVMINDLLNNSIEKTKENKDDGNYGNRNAK